MGSESRQVRPLPDLVKEARAALENEMDVVGTARPLLAPSAETAAAENDLDMAIYVADLEMTKRRRRYAMAAHYCQMLAEVKAIEESDVAMGAFHEVVSLLKDNRDTPDLPGVTASYLAGLADAMEVAMVEDDGDFDLDVDPDLDEVIHEVADMAFSL